LPDGALPRVASRVEFVRLIGTRLVLGVEVGLDGVVLGADGDHLVAAGAGGATRLPVLVVPVFTQQGDAGQRNTDENHDEHPTDVLDGDALRLVVLAFAELSGGVLVPPLLLQHLQLASVE